MTALAAYEAGLAGADCWMRAEGGDRRRLPVARWAAAADDRDQAITATTLARMPNGGSVLDVGCGPGRLTVALAEAGAHQSLRVLGIDISAAAVDLALARGAAAVVADVFSARPEHSHGWDRVLLADGNIGIGGDPIRLLRRAARLLRSGGRVIADVGRVGGVVRAPAWIESVGPAGGPIGGPVPWAWVGVDAVVGIGAQAGLRLHSVRRHRRGPVVVWEAMS